MSTLSAYQHIFLRQLTKIRILWYNMTVRNQKGFFYGSYIRGFYLGGLYKGFSRGVILTRYTTQRTHTDHTTHRETDRPVCDS